MQICEHYICDIKSCTWRAVLDTTLCDKLCQCPAADWCVFPGTPVSSTNKTDRHNITEILLKVASNTITLTLTKFRYPIIGKHA